MNRVLVLASLLLPLMWGCVDNGGEYRELTEADDVENTHEHHHHDHAEGPHGGHVLEFGKYHGEITMGKDRTVSVYVLGMEDMSKAIPVAGTATLHLKVGEEEQAIELTAAPQEGEAEGESSRYTTTEIPESIKDIEGIAGHVELKVGEETMKAEISHDHHGHDHHDH